MLGDEVGEGLGCELLVGSTVGTVVGPEVGIKLGTRLKLGDVEVLGKVLGTAGT